MRNLLKESLKSLSISELRFIVKPTLTDELISKISEASPPDKDGDNVFLDSYKVNNVSHLAIAVVSKVKKREDVYNIDCRCQVAKGGILSKDTPKISRLIEILSDVKESQHFHCLARFLYGKRAKFKPIVKLPIRITDKTKVPFNEIHGVHFAKIVGKKLENEVILDLLEGGGYTETVIFGHSSKIGVSIVRDIVEKAKGISDNFVYTE